MASKRREVREAAGKSPEGLLKLRARQEGSHVIVEVIDDGGGIRVERIRDKAIERRLITPQKAAQLIRSRAAAVDLSAWIFDCGEGDQCLRARAWAWTWCAPTWRRIGGKVEIDSRPGKGTTLRLSIPLTLAIIPALIVRSRKQDFALPQGALRRAGSPDGRSRRRTQIEWLENAPLYRLRGQAAAAGLSEHGLLAADRRRLKRTPDATLPC